MIKIDTSDFDLNSAIDRQKMAIQIYADTAAKKMMKEAKRNAPWIDRTGHARQNIEGSSGWEGDKHRIVLSGGMDYSVYLELAHEKKYAILKPTIDKNAAEILRGYQRLVRD